MDYDYIVLGSGIAGLHTAILARKLGRVLVLTKGSLEECNTQFAQGGIAAPVGPEDTPALHWEDTIKAGAGLCDEEAVRVLTEEATDRIHDLIALGVPFDTTDGEIALGREGAHSVCRVLHAGGDATGANIENTLSCEVRAAGIDILEHHVVTSIQVENGAVVGVRALDDRGGKTRDFGGRFVVLATGGAGQLYEFNTNPPVATGDGVALAYRAGAEIADIEFFQFHPTALRLPGAPSFLISEAARGEGAILRNADGCRFAFDYDPSGELAPRDIVARAILSEMNKAGTDHVYLDLSHLPASKITTRFPSIYRFCLGYGLDITTTPIPIAPAAHYMIGGVRTGTWGETNLPGLYACGEVACTGVHGANRLASNSLLEGLVFARRIVQKTEDRRQPRATGGRSSPKTETGAAAASVVRLPASGTEGPCPSDVQAPPVSLAALQSLMWEDVGMVRSRRSLERARDTLAVWGKTMPKPRNRSEHELDNLVLVGRLMAEAALLREESRGAHFREDFPEPREEWLRHLVLRQNHEAVLRLKERESRA